MPIAQNQFLHASAPVRMILGLLAGIKWFLTRGQDHALYPSRSSMLGVCLYDGLGGAAVAYYLGTAGGQLVV